MKRAAFLFPGQGAQYPGMGKDWHDRYPAVKRIFEEASDVLKYDLKRVCFEGKSETLKDTRITQPAVLTVSVAALEIFRQEVGIAPVYCAGFSLGEYSALCFAEAIRFEDALRLVQARAELMHEAAETDAGAMLAVRGVGERQGSMAFRAGGRYACGRHCQGSDGQGRNESQVLAADPELRTENGGTCCS